jgi:hypothetical protein
VTHRLPDAPTTAPLGPHLHGAEPAHVVRVVEHEADHGLGLVDLCVVLRGVERDKRDQWNEEETTEHQDEDACLL